MTAHTARAVVDRIEGDVAVVEICGTLVNLPQRALPPGATEGSAWALRWEPLDPPPAVRDDPPRPPVIDLTS
ncbi:MAG TPA: DUF3006 domain-containing protein [Myxococcota bacterium]|nr:DUF3006 domain-containing protein [Myxococcota bacterium]